MRNWIIPFSFVLMAVTVPQIKSAPIAFSGSAAPVGHFFISNGGVFNWDFSNLVASDTPDGMAISGSVSGTTSGGPANTGGILEISTFRPFSLPAGTDLVLTSSLSATVSTTGPFNVYWVLAETFLSNFPPIGCDVQAGVGGDATTDVITGSISAGPNSSLCQTDANSIFLNTVAFIGFTVPTENATITVDFGQTVLGEARFVPTAVPEPSSLLLVAGALPLLWFLRKLRFLPFP